MDIVERLAELGELGEAINPIEKVLDDHGDKCKSSDPEGCAFETACLASAVVMTRLGLCLHDIGHVAEHLMAVELVTHMAFAGESDEVDDALEATEIG